MFDQFTTDLPSSLSDRVCRLGIVPEENNFVLAHARGTFSWFSLSLMVTMVPRCGHGLSLQWTIMRIRQSSIIHTLTQP